MLGKVDDEFRAIFWHIVEGAFEDYGNVDVIFSGAGPALAAFFIGMW
jgi:hypothetical protein